MTIPFLDLFNKLRDRLSAKAVQPPAAPSLPRVVRPSGDRLSKTVLPRPGAPRVIGSSAPRQFAPAPRARELPPALAKALEPKLERAISLQLSDFLEQIPAEYVKPVEVIDANRPVTLKASEIEKGMPEQKPSISLTSLYQQVPEIFLRTIAPTDSTRVALPYDKVLEQFASVQVRSDQQRDDRVPQLETPILQATIEDTERFGTKMQPVESSDSPSVRVKPATAETIASAEPEAAVTEVIASTKPQPTHPVVKLGATTSQPEKSPFSLDFKTSAPPPPLRIPFQFPPNGTGAPASERVPASSGPPVPPVSIPPLKLTPAEPTADTIEQPRQPSPEMPPEKKPVTLKLEDESLAPLADRPAAPAKQVAPDKTAIPFRVEQQPVEPLRVSAETDSPKALAATSPVPAKPQAKASDRDFDTSEDEDGPTISLGLKPLFENLPLFQREGDIDALSGTARITFPLDLVQPQLATGRVLIPSKTFQRALPPNYRSLFVVDREETPVSLPLQEILKNLPAGVLKVREDQQRFSAEDDFVTPFSLKAKEDATRLQLATTGPAAEPTKPSAGQPNQTPNPPAAAEKTIDGKDVIAAACQLPGVAGCELMFPDGLNLAGNLPADMALDGLCAMAPTLLQRIDSHMLETKLGSLFAMTLHGENAAVTFLATENVCLAALHKDAAALASESRAKLHELLEQLSLAFAKPEAPHVDH